MKLKDMMKRGEQLMKEGHGNKDLIFASDDEGNSYHKVYNSLTLAQVHNIKLSEVELVGVFPRQPEIALEDCNAIIIN